MTHDEQNAFIEAYVNNVGNVSADRVEAFLRSYEAGKNITYEEEYTSILDALGMWHEAVRWGIGK
jgi:hypothetical protein